MRSYEAARGYFGFLELISWGVILAGVALAIGGLAAGSQASVFGTRSGAAGILAAIPGLRLAFSGLIGIVAAQIGRAGVDSAEYAQQSLKIAREQLEISRHMAMGRKDNLPSFAERVSEANSQNGPSFAGSETAASEQVDMNSTGETEKLAADKPAVVNTSDFRGKKLVEYEDGTYTLGSQSFSSLESVKEYVRLELIRSGGFSVR